MGLFRCLGVDMSADRFIKKSSRWCVEASVEKKFICGSQRKGMYPSIVLYMVCEGCSKEEA